MCQKRYVFEINTLKKHQKVCFGWLADWLAGTRCAKRSRGQRLDDDMMEYCVTRRLFEEEMIKPDLQRTEFRSLLPNLPHAMQYDISTPK
mmetsp:Transcript_9042/g.13531  ORF Transcript_9042/g.13531 Transcript_9042/m.13531 type:complete len:90 (-) Transcript_9042:134-403(-)